MEVVQILNTIRANAGDMYAERVPEATQQNITKVGNAILELEATTNMFLDALVTRIAFTEVSNRRFKNPLAILKSTGVPFGTTIEEIYTNPVAAKTFDGSNTSDMLEVNKPDTKTIYHTMNRKDKYPISISEDQLRGAFTTAGELGAFIQSVINAMYSGDEMDEYLLMRNTISDAVAKNKLKVHEVPWSADETSAKNLVILMKTIATNMQFPSHDYNGYNVLNASGITGKTVTPAKTWCPAEDLVLLIRSDVDAVTDVEVLAKAFNMEKTDFIKRKKVIDSFGDADTLMVLADRKIFKFKDNNYKVRSFSNGSNLITNYWLHHWQTLSLSLFGNAVVIKQEAA